MNMKKTLTGGALAVALLGGGALGAAQLGGVASADSSDTAPSNMVVAETSEDGHEGCNGARHHDGHRGGRHLDTAAEAIGVAPEDLRVALEDGSTIAEVAEANSVDPQVVIDAMVAELSDRLDEGVAAGRLTADEATERLGRATEKITTSVNEGRPEHPERPAGDPGAETSSV
jgi:hypothetical protein